MPQGGAWKWPGYPVWVWLQLLVPPNLHGHRRNGLRHAHQRDLRRVGLWSMLSIQGNTVGQVQAIVRNHRQKKFLFMKTTAKRKYEWSEHHKYFLFLFTTLPIFRWQTKRKRWNKDSDIIQKDIILMFKVQRHRLSKQPFYVSKQTILLTLQRQYQLKAFKQCTPSIWSLKNCPTSPKKIHS